MFMIMFMIMFMSMFFFASSFLLAAPRPHSLSLRDLMKREASEVLSGPPPGPPPFQLSSQRFPGPPPSSIAAHPMTSTLEGSYSDPNDKEPSQNGELDPNGIASDAAEPATKICKNSDDCPDPTFRAVHAESTGGVVWLEQGTPIFARHQNIGMPGQGPWYKQIVSKNPKNWTLVTIEG